MTDRSSGRIMGIVMDERDTLHRVEDDLRETWIDEWSDAGFEALEEYLAKHLAFQSFLDDAATA